VQSDGLAGEKALVAILRGVVPERALDVARVLYAVGFRKIEVPLNSPDPFASIAALAAGLPPDCLVGAGTVLNAGDVGRTHAAGGGLIVSPNFDAEVIGAATQRAMQVLPGVATATEAFAALRAGARQLKLFPATTYGPRHLQALRTVLPPGTQILSVGGIAADHLVDWLAAGAAGFGFGSELFRPEYGLGDIERRGQLLVRAFREARERLEMPPGETATKKTTGESA
jgi:2-dehydro-3-deoxyphosphogalactonate aldolase